jgi:hypothetical protein
MTHSQAVSQPVIIYTPGFRWSGHLTIAFGRRLSDLFNVLEEDLIAFEQVALFAREGDPAQPILTMDRVAISRSNIIAILCAEGSDTSRGGVADRVVKVPHRVVIVVPPLILTGDFHATREVDWFSALSLSRQKFLSLTSVDVASLTPGLVFGSRAEFALVNRQKMIAVDLSG